VIVPEPPLAGLSSSSQELAQKTLAPIKTTYIKVRKILLIGLSGFRFNMFSFAFNSCPLTLPFLPTLSIATALQTLMLSGNWLNNGLKQG
jgi:hypothetical protein